MKVAITVGAFLLHDFVDLNLRQCRRVFPDSPLLVSDDISPRSNDIAKIAKNAGATYIGSNSRRGHFAGDFTAILNAITFAQAHKSDLAVKVSQRFIFKNEVARTLLLDKFEQTLMSYGLPGRMTVDTVRPGGTFSFTMMPVLTDLMVFRVSDCDPEAMACEYKKKVSAEWGTATGTYIEAIANDWAYSRFKDKTVFLDDFTKHINGRHGGDLYLRRNQNHKESYIELAREHGINGDFNLGEWASLEGRAYYPRPRAL